MGMRRSLSHSPGKISVQNLPSFGGFRVPGTSAYLDSISEVGVGLVSTSMSDFEDKISPRPTNSRLRENLLADLQAYVKP